MNNYSKVYLNKYVGDVVVMMNICLECGMIKFSIDCHYFLNNRAKKRSCHYSYEKQPMLAEYEEVQVNSLKQRFDKIGQKEVDNIINLELKK